MKKQAIHISDQEHHKLEEIVKKGKSSARLVRRAQILLLSHEGKEDSEIASFVRCSLSTIYLIKRKYREEGLKDALNDKPRAGRPEKLRGKAKAHLLALACSEPPEGRAFWTMQLLADRCIALELVEVVSDETVRRTLKKMKSNPGK